MFGIFIWLLITVLCCSWMHFHYPGFDNWRPETFSQFCGYLFGGLLWFFVGMLAAAFTSPHYKIKRRKQ